MLSDIGFTIENQRQPATYMCHNGSSTIDLFFTNRPGNCGDTVRIEESTITKHRQVILNFDSDIGTYDMTAPNRGWGKNQVARQENQVTRQKNQSTRQTNQSTRQTNQSTRQQNYVARQDNQVASQSKNAKYDNIIVISSLNTNIYRRNT